MFAAALLATGAVPATPLPTLPEPSATETLQAQPVDPVAPVTPPAPVADPVLAAPKPESASAAPASAPGDIVVTADAGAPQGDPAMAVNLASFEAVQAVDQALVEPLADGYKAVVPHPLRQGIHNALNNLSEPINFVNDLLQLKPGRALRTLARFAVNSTLGLGGLLDVAENRPFRLPYRRNGFANTLGYYGVGNGPYLFLPLIGPTTLRDLTGRLMDLSLLPTVVKGPLKSPYYSIGTGALRSVDDRVEIDGFLQALRHNCPDRYAAERQYYLASRQAEIAALHNRTIDLAAMMPDCLLDAPTMRGTRFSVPVPAAPPAGETPAGQAPVTPAM